MFSTRVTTDLTPNRLAQAIAHMRAERRPFIDLTLSNPTRAGFDYPPDLLAALTDPRALQYEPSALGSIDARQAVAADYTRQGIDVAPGRVVLTASTSDAYSILFKLLANAGDDVLVPHPSYPLFDHLARFDLVTARAYDLEYHGAWSIDFASLERAITPHTRAVLVVSPNNPTGSFIAAAELDRLAAVCAPRDVAIIADEVFADYELTPGARASAGRAAARRDALTFTLGGLSKSIGLPQVKLGWIAVGGPDSLVRQTRDRLEVLCDTYLSVSTPVQVAAGRLLEQGAAVRGQILDRIRANNQRMKWAVAAVPSCRLLPSDGGWYGVLQVPSLESEDDLVVGLLTTDAVLAHPGYFFDFARESFLIVSLLAPPDDFAEGIARILRHFECRPPRP